MLLLVAVVTSVFVGMLFVDPTVVVVAAEEEKDVGWTCLAILQAMVEDLQRAMKRRLQCSSSA